jgi:hypothetical protein
MPYAAYGSLNPAIAHRIEAGAAASNHPTGQRLPPVTTMMVTSSARNRTLVGAGGKHAWEENTRGVKRDLAIVLTPARSSGHVLERW